MISYVVQEKELRQKELMKMMSVSECDIECSWFITFMILNIVAASFSTFVSCFLFPYSSPYLLWIFWVFTYFALTLFCTALAACSNVATRGVFMGLLCFFSGLLPSIVLPIRSLSSFLKLIFLLHPVAIFSYGITLLGGLDDLALGLTSQTINYVHDELTYSFHIILVSYTYCCILWFIVTWYLNRIVTPEYGQAPFPYWFPCSPAYWKSFFLLRTYPKEMPTADEPLDTVSASKTQSGDAASNKHKIPNDCENTSKDIAMEAVSESLRKQSKNGESIEIVDLRKSFGDTTAVDGLDLSMYNGQITALLGHNG
jgi:ABC-type multidrug transport system fused ATPase/permease subunit